MQIPILSGIYASEAPDFRTSYPVNLVPVPKSTGIAEGYLRPGDGIVQFGTGPGIDRGGIEWNGVCYRVMGAQLVRINADGSTDELGAVGGFGQASLTYSFDRLAIASGGALYYWNGTALTQVTDGDLGTALDVTWQGGYFITTDGENLVVTELTDPTQVNPLKYGSSEVQPDPVLGVLNVHDELAAINRHTIEYFRNVGGDFFPFQRIEGAQIDKGAVGTHAACLFDAGIAFVGSGRNEAPSVYVGANGTAVKIATREIDQVLAEYTEAEMADVVCEARVDGGHKFLYIHLPDRTAVYDLAAANELQAPVWYWLTSSLTGFETYRARNFVRCYDRWLCGDPTSATHGYITDAISTHYGDHVRWEFGTMVVYNESRGAIFNALELVCLPGRVALGRNPTISTSYSLDGETWSQDRHIRAGAIGERNKRLCWMQLGHMRNWRIQRFRGDSQAHIAIARIEAQLEALGA